jgi:hypothetical protein
MSVNIAVSLPGFGPDHIAGRSAKRFSGYLFMPIKERLRIG